MFIRFIETVAPKFPTVATKECVDVGTCFHWRQPVATNRDGTVVYFMLGIFRHNS